MYPNIPKAIKERKLKGELLVLDDIICFLSQSDKQFRKKIMHDHKHQNRKIYTVTTALYKNLLFCNNTNIVCSYLNVTKILVLIS